MTAHRLRTAVVLSSAALVTATLSVGSTAAAHDGDESWKVVADGLDSPRQITFARNGAMYVTEAGTGGDATIADGPNGELACFGNTGAVTRVKGAKQRRVLDDLPSIGIFSCTEFLGPSQIVFKRHQNRFALLFGLGADPAVREALPDAAEDLATLQTGKVKGNRLGRLHEVADIGAFEATENPDEGLPDSNPVALLRDHGDYIVADAGGNALLEVDDDIEALAVFPDRQVPAPPFLGLPPGTQIPMQAVPTSVAKGPDGAYYVSQLTGFPFPVGGAKIWRVEDGAAPEVYAEGLTNVTDLGFHDGDLYAVQIADSGLLGEPIGSLLKIDPDGNEHETVAGDLFAPYSVAFRRDSAYVSICSVCTDTGEVIKIGLDD